MGLRILLAALTGAFIIYTFLKSKGGSRLPPGPRGKPVIGNLLDLPAAGKQEWQHWLKHKDLYGNADFSRGHSPCQLIYHCLISTRPFELAFDLWNYPCDYQ